MADYTSEQPHIECVDEWPTGTISRTTMDAYVEMERRGQIKIGQVQYGQNSGRVTIIYTATIPHEWAKQALRKTRDAIQARVAL